MFIDPLISIVIPCFNHGQYIIEAINSIEEYKSSDYEIIIVNDGSTDSYTNAILDGLRSKEYNIIFQKNQGLGKTRNNGIKIAKGKYILPLDADNKIKPEFMIRAIEVLESHANISIVYTDRQLFGNSTDLIKVGELDKSRLVRANYIDACAIFRKEVWTELGGYDEKMPFQGLEDWDFWLSAISKGFEFFYISEPLFLYRNLDDSMIRQLNKNPQINELIEYIYKKHISLLIGEYRACYDDSIKYQSDNKRLFRTSIKYLYKWLFRSILK